MIHRAGILAFCLAAAAVPPASAEDCDVETPCEIKLPSGVYHAALPPKDVAGDGPHPALVFLHGWGGTGAATIRNKALVGEVTGRGYAFLAPTGQPRSGGRSGANWNTRARIGEGMRDDIAFLADVLDDAAVRLDIDRNRVLTSGFSSGGMMAWRVVCDAPETAAAYAPIAGLMWRPLPETCAGPAKLLHVHGWADPVVPMEGRSIRSGAATQGDLFVGLDLLRDAFGCAADQPDETWLRDGFWRRAWTACAPGAHLEFALHPGGHAVPKGWATLALDWFEAVTDAAAEIQ